MAEILAIDRGAAGARGAAGRRTQDSSGSAQQTFAFASPIADAEAREHALDTTVSWIVEAPAGSGKTGLLIQRYLKLLSGTDVTSPAQVLAITFTRSATEEIRTRILEEFRAAADETPADGPFASTLRSLAGAALARDRALGWGLLDAPDQLRVRTIDSVCAEIARLLPVLSGGGGTATPVDDAQALFRQAARRTLLQLGGEDRPLNEAVETVLLHREGDLAGCEELIAEMLATRDQWGSLLPLGREELTEHSLEQEVRPKLDRALERAVCAGLERVSQILPPSLLVEMAEAAAEMSSRPGVKGAPSPLACCSAGTPPQAIAEHLEQWRALARLLLTKEGTWRKGKGIHSGHLKFLLTLDDKQRLQALIESLQQHEESLPALCSIDALPPARYPDDQWLVAKALFRLLQRALAELKVVFAETGECDFAEPAMLARTALTQDEGGRAYGAALGVELRHLLVDEMQDTSSGQYDLLELLTRGWAGEGRTVFLVGDPKQSIYLFRQARVERFVRTMRERQLGDLPLGCLRLTANFRSQSSLVSAFNRDFGRIFPAESTRDDEISYTLAQPVRGASPGPHEGAIWHTDVVSGKETERNETKLEIARSNADEIRRIVTEWRDRPLPQDRVKPWTIAVLVSSRRELKPVVAALKGEDSGGPIPFRAIKVEPLGEQPEVLDLVALTRALSHPADRVAWWAIFRAPWCGLELHDLHQLAGADDPSFRERTVLALVREREHLLSGDSRARAQIVADVLASSVNQAERLPLPELVERTWRALGGHTYLRPPALSNAAQFFHLLTSLCEQEGHLANGAMERSMTRLFAAPNLAEDAVDLATIHGAKGLEWDVVLIPELERPAPPARSRLLEWEEVGTGGPDSAAAVLAPMKSTVGESGALNKWLSHLRSERLAAERRRQFYVACTRAREELHLFATADLSSEGTEKPEAMSLLRAAWPAAQERFGYVEPAGDPEAARRLTRLLRRAAKRAQPGLALAAAAASPLDNGASSRGGPIEPALLTRLSLHSIQAASQAEAGAEQPRAAARQSFPRPEGSFLARSLGNAVHSFLEQAAKRLADGNRAADLERDLPRWRDRIRAVLRADGIGSAEITRLANDVETAVRQTLGSATGRWLLGARTDAQSEYALTVARESIRQVRLDRIFRGGASPEATGNTHLWIVDYKTGSHAAAGLDAWLTGERARYAGQMANYAGVFPDEPVNLALWYPMVARLVWWPAAE